MTVGNFSTGSVVNHERKKPKLVCTERFEDINRILTNKEKDTFTSLNRSVYNTKQVGLKHIDAPVVLRFSLGDLQTIDSLCY